MKKNQIIHIRLDPDEAIESRKDVLNTEVDLIKIAQEIKKYRILRLRELQLKIELYKKVKEFRTEMNKLKSLLPKLEIPRILKKHEEDMHKEFIIKDLKPKEEKTKKAKGKTQEPAEPPEDDLERQLKEIQDKLNKLG